MMRRTAHTLLECTMSATFVSGHHWKPDSCFLTTVHSIDNIRLPAQLPSRVWAGTRHCATTCTVQLAYWPRHTASQAAESYVSSPYLNILHEIVAEPRVHTDILLRVFLLLTLTMMCSGLALTISAQRHSEPTSFFCRTDCN